MLPFKSSTINFTDKGRGKTVVLLHGYLESLEIWNGFADELARTFRVIAIDLPGHGLSGVVASIHTMDLLAEAVDAVLRHLDIDKAFIIGHSMGGYIALAFVRLYPERVRGLGLIASQVLADAPDRKEGRYKSADDVSKNGIGSVVETMTPKFTPVASLQAYARASMERQQPAAYVGALRAMAERMDRGIGRILAALKERGVEQNTLVLFFSDNGGCAEVIQPDWYDVPSRTRVVTADA